MVEVLEWAGNDGGKGAKEEVTEDSLRNTTAEMSAEARDQWGEPHESLQAPEEKDPSDVQR